MHSAAPCYPDETSSGDNDNDVECRSPTTSLSSWSSRSYIRERDRRGEREREREIAALINSEKLMFANGIAMASPIPSARGAFFPLPLPLLLAPAPRAPSLSLLSTLHLDLPRTPPPLGPPFPLFPPFSNVLYLHSGFSSPPLRAHPIPPFFLLSLSLSLSVSFLSVPCPSLPFVRHLLPPLTHATVPLSLRPGHANFLRDKSRGSKLDPGDYRLKSPLLVVSMRLTRGAAR